MAALLNTCWGCTIDVVCERACSPGAATQGLPLRADAAALLASAASWPLECALLDAAEAAKLKPVLGHAWSAATLLSSLLMVSTREPTLAANLPKPSILARCAVALLAFAQLQSILGLAPPDDSQMAGGPTEMAQQAAAWLRHHPKAALRMYLANAPDDIMAAAAAVRFLS